MNKFIFSALAASLVSTTGFATETDWPELDREIEALSSTLDAHGGGPTLSGWVIVSWTYSDDFLTGGEDTSGADFKSIRLNVKGSTADYAYKVSGDFKNGSDFELTLRDAWGSWNFAENLTGKFGAFKAPTLQSALLARNKTLMIDRSRIGSILLAASGNAPFSGGRDAGIQLHGSFETVSWALAIQNGDDGAADEYQITARASVDLVGEGAGQTLEGAFGAGDAFSLSAGLFYWDEGSLDDATAIGGEVYMTAGPWAASLEAVDFDEGVGDVTPWDATASYMFTDQWEAAVRWQDHDDDVNDTTDLIFGVNYYVSGHDVKWQLNYCSTDSDDDAQDGDEIKLALVTSF